MEDGSKGTCRDGRGFSKSLTRVLWMCLRRRELETDEKTRRTKRMWSALDMEGRHPEPRKHLIVVALRGQHGASATSISKEKGRSQ